MSRTTFCNWLQNYNRAMLQLRQNGGTLPSHFSPCFCSTPSLLIPTYGFRRYLRIAKRPLYLWMNQMGSSLQYRKISSSCSVVYLYCSLRNTSDLLRNLKILSSSSTSGRSGGQKTEVHAGQLYFKRIKEERREGEAKGMKGEREEEREIEIGLVLADRNWSCVFTDLVARSQFGTNSCILAT